MTPTTHAGAEKTTRKQWIEQAKSTLDAWDQSLDEIQAKIDDSRAQIRADLRARLDAARETAADARKKWEQIRTEAGDVADAVGDEVAFAWDANKLALERSLEQIRSALP